MPVCSARRPRRPSRPSTVASRVAASRIAARLRSPSDGACRAGRLGGGCEQLAQIRLDKIARPVVLCSHGERSIVLLPAMTPPRSTPRCAAWLEERNVGVFAAWWRQSVVGAGSATNSRAAPSCGTSQTGLRDLVDELKGVEVATTSRTAARTRAARPPSLLAFAGTQTASGRSAHFSCGTAITAASSTAGWPISAFSSATEEIHSPPDLMTSFVRSWMRMTLPGGATRCRRS